MNIWQRIRQALGMAWQTWKFNEPHALLVAHGTDPKWPEILFTDQSKNEDIEDFILFCFGECPPEGKPGITLYPVTEEAAA